MSIQSTQIDLAKRILETKDKHLLHQVEAVLSSFEDDFWNNLSSAQKESVVNARNQIKKGEYKSHAEVRSKYKKWLTK